MRHKQYRYYEIIDGVAYVYNQPRSEQAQSVSIVPVADLSYYRNNFNLQGSVELDTCQPCGWLFFVCHIENLSPALGLDSRSGPGYSHRISHINSTVNKFVVAVSCLQQSTVKHYLLYSENTTIRKFYLAS